MWTWNETQPNTGYLQHSSHKYVDKKWVNGKWEYIYPEDLQKQSNSKVTAVNSTAAAKAGEQGGAKGGSIPKHAKLLAEWQRGLVNANIRAAAKAAEEAKSTENHAKKNKENKKSETKFESVVNDVIRGKYGNGAERIKKLTEAGYDYKTIQNLVNQKVLGAKKAKIATPAPTKKVATVNAAASTKRATTLKTAGKANTNINIAARVGLPVNSTNRLRKRGIQR